MTNVTPKQKKRTWAAYACPGCRFVFRVPKNHDGEGVICPACRYLLKLPKSSSFTKPSPSRTSPIASKVLATSSTAPVSTPTSTGLGESKAKIPFQSKPARVATVPSTSEASSSQRHTTRNSSGSRHGGVRQKSKRSTSAEPSWDKRPSTSVDGQGNGLAWVVGGSLLGLLLVGLGAWLLLGSEPAKTKKSASKGLDQQEDWSHFEAEPSDVVLTAKEKKVQNELQETVETGMNVVEESEKVVRAFLTAKTPKELESLVRNPEVTVPRMRAWYSKHEWKPFGVKDLGYGGGITVKGVMVSLRVRLENFSVCNIALERTKSGYLVDWESFVVWSEIEWKDLFKLRPTEPVAVRVICSPDSYYNREFSDDKKWLAIRMKRSDDERSLYGYIDSHTSTLTRLLGDLKGGQSVAAILKIRYPKNAKSDNQVFIEEYVQNGWVAQPEEEGEPANSKTPTPASDE